MCTSRGSDAAYPILQDTCQTYDLSRASLREDLTVLSLGAGVQSTALLLMALEGEITPRPDAAIFADTGWEPSEVYEHLDWLETLCAAHQFPILRVSKGNLRADTLAAVDGGNWGFAAMPLFVRSPTSGKSSMMRRQCTNQYKIIPVRRGIRQLLGTNSPRGKHVSMWMGISIDEVTRVKPSRVQYITHRYPLIERGMSRADCLLWLASHGYPAPPRSACVGCPLHSTAEWRDIQAHPQQWADVVQFDNAIRHLPRVKGDVFIHPSLRPMEGMIFDPAYTDAALWDAECEGYCHV